MGYDKRLVIALIALMPGPQADQWQTAMQLKGAAVATASYNAVAWPVGVASGKHTRNYGEWVICV